MVLTAEPCLQALAHIIKPSTGETVTGGSLGLVDQVFYLLGEFQANERLSPPSPK